MLKTMMHHAKVRSLGLGWIESGKLMSTIAERAKGLRKSVFAEFSELAKIDGAVNLGQGFPSFAAPKFLKDAAVKAIMEDHNQYTRPGGHPELTEVLAEMYSEKLGRSINPMTEVVTFNGAQEGIVSIFAALMNPGDEVLLIEPFFDAYVNAANLLGLKTVGVPLKFTKEVAQKYHEASGEEKFSSADLTIDLEILESKITDKTRMIVMNTPHNPTGKMFSKEELLQLTSLLANYPQIRILSDEVYEYMGYDGTKHERLAKVPGMFDRVISLFSAGKTFSCTGWRCGYAILPESLQDPVLRTHNAIPFCGTTPLELAVAEAFRQAPKEDYYATLASELCNKRDLMCNALAKAKLRPIVPQGGYFVIVDVSRLKLFDKVLPVEQNAPVSSMVDYQMCKVLSKHAGVTCIPTSPFYSPENQHLAGASIRVAFCKDLDTLNAAIDAIGKLEQK